MKKLRKKLLSFVALTLIACSLISVTVYAENPDSPDGGVSLLSNNTRGTSDSFFISTSGTATVSASYTGISGVTTGATIEIKLQRKVWFWWSDVSGAAWTDTVTGNSGSVTHTFNLTQTGDYRAIIDYTISGTGGSPDEISKTLLDTY